MPTSSPHVIAERIEQMLQNVAHFLRRLSQELRIADILDIALIAVLLYVTLTWFRQRATRSLVVGVLLVTTLYFAARRLDMYLTTMLFDVGFTALLLALIVVFQQDIRRVFERFAFGGLQRGQSGTGPIEHTIDQLVESLRKLAADRTGALVAIECDEPLDRHVHGGVPVEGWVSVPLLYSIFFPQSPGHDGAVLVRGDRIERLGVHLPLSNNLTELEEVGTRHAAALGLSEVSDALVIAVSEERGTISVASHGRLRKVEPSELKGVLEQVYRHLNHQPRSGFWPGILTDNPVWKLLSLAFAVALWLAVAYRLDTVQRTFVVPIEYRNLPANYVARTPWATNAVVTLSGSERALAMLDPSALVISFDMSNVEAGKSYRLPTEEGLSVPSEVTVTEIDPNEVVVTISQRPPASGSSPAPGAGARASPLGGRWPFTEYDFSATNALASRPNSSTKSWGGL